MMTVGRWSIFVMLLLFVPALASCGQNTALPAPTLYANVSAQPDTTFVTRGDVSSMVILDGLTRLPTGAAQLEVGGGRIGTIYAWPGEYVVEGQMAARLDASSIETQIASYEENIARANTLHRFQVDEMTLQIELLELIYVNEPSHDIREQIEWIRLDLSHLQIRHGIEAAEAQAALTELRQGLSNTEIRAPFDGIVVYTADLDTWVNANDPVVFIAEPQGVFVELTGGGLHRDWLRQDVRILGVIGDRTYQLAYAPTTLEEQRQYRQRGLGMPTRFEILADPTDLPSHGEVVFIHFYTAWADDVLRIPINAMFGNWQDGNYVYRFENGEQVRVYISVGLITTSYVEVLEGLNEGDEIFVRP